MILNIKSYLLKIDIYSILVLLIFLAAPLRFYVSTSIILEIVTFGLVVWGFAKHKFTKKIWSPTASKFVVYFFIYFIFLSVRLNRLKNKLLANYLRNRGNDLATVRNSAFCVAILSNNSFICKYNIFFRKYELSVAILKIGLRKKKNIHPIHEIMLCNK